MKGLQPRTLSRLLMVLFIGLVVLIGLLAAQQLGERNPPVQVPAPEQSSSVAPIHADGPLHEVSENAWSGIRNQPRWVF